MKQQTFTDIEYGNRNHASDVPVATKWYFCAVWQTEQIAVQRSTIIGITSVKHMPKA